MLFTSSNYTSNDEDYLFYKVTDLSKTSLGTIRQHNYKYRKINQGLKGEFDNITDSMQGDSRLNFKNMNILFNMPDSEPILPVFQSFDDLYAWVSKNGIQKCPTESQTPVGRTLPERSATSMSERQPPRSRTPERRQVR